MSINSKKKGSRVELELVHWLKERGITSARRTQQFSGKEGTSDVVAPDELPSFHIEVKGTASGKLERSKLNAWFEQIYNDRVADSTPVIFHKANNTPWVGLISCGAYIKLFGKGLCRVSACVEESFTPYKYLIGKRLEYQIMGDMLQIPENDMFSVGYFLGEMNIVAIFADDLLTRMLKYEAGIKINK